MRLNRPRSLLSARSHVALGVQVDLCQVVRRERQLVLLLLAKVLGLVHEVFKLVLLVLELELLLP